MNELNKLPYELNRVHQEDSILAMSKFPESSVDIIIADPPYNTSFGINLSFTNEKHSLPGFGGEWKKVMEEWDNMPMMEYFQFTMAWLREAKRILKPTGSMWIHGTYHNIGIINFCMQILEIEIINEIVWYKRNSFPNLTGRRLTASHETILWSHSGSAKSRKYNFNYEASKEFGELSDNLKIPGKQMRTVWDIPNNKKRDELELGKHPTQKPLKLIDRLLMISAPKEGVLLSPFAGSGTDCLSGLKFGLNVIGFDFESEFVELSNARIKKYLEENSNVQHTFSY